MYFIFKDIYHLFIISRKKKKKKKERRKKRKSVKRDKIKKKINKIEGVILAFFYLQVFGFLIKQDQKLKN